MAGRDAQSLDHHYQHKPWERAYARTVIRLRWVTFALVAAISLAAGVFAQRVDFDSDIKIWFLEDDPSLKTYEAFLEKFEADEVAVVGVFADDIYTPEHLERLSELTEAVKAAPFVHRVRSLANTEYFASEDDEITIAPLLESLPDSQSDCEVMRLRVRELRLIHGALISHDEKATAILVEVGEGAASFAGKVQFVDAMRRILKKFEGQGLTLRLTGSPAMDEAVYRYSKHDFALLSPLVLLFVVLATWLVFRRLSAIVVSLATVGLATLWTFGLMGVLGIDINLISVSLVAIILAVGIAVSIHIMADFYQQLMVGKDAHQALEDSVATLVVPCFFTSATTVIGFLSLLISELRVVSQFGWLAAIGVAIAFVLSMSLAPALLRVMPPPKARTIQRKREGPISSVLRVIGRPSRGFRTVVLAVSVPLVVGSMWATTQLDVGSNPLEYFKLGDPVRFDHEEVDRALGGSLTVEFLLTAPNGGLKEPRVLRRLDELQTWLLGLPAVHRVISPVDMLKEMNRVMHDGASQHFVLPHSRALAAQYYLLMEDERDFSSMMQDDYSVGRMTMLVSTGEAGLLSRRHKITNTKIETEYQDDELHVQVTGFVKLMGDMERYLLSSQRRSFLLALVLVTAMLSLLLRSVKLGLFSMIPNVAPIVVGMAFMWLMDISLSPGTVMIGAIALGLVVDDTVHYLVRVRRHVKAGRNLDDAIAYAMEGTGRPIIVTSVVLAVGFSVLTLASFTPDIHFGMVTAVVILLALLADLLMLPAALLLIRPRL